MKRRRWVLIILAIVTLVILSASASLVLFFSPVSSSLSASSGVKNGFQLTVTIKTISYSKGDNIPITFMVTNVSNQALNFTNTNGNANFNFQIYNSANERVYSWLHGAYPLTNVTIQLAPNETYSQTLIWSQINDTTDGFAQVPSGTYQIIGDIGAIPYQLQTQILNITIC
jgi:hypothetical protein